MQRRVRIEIRGKDEFWGRAFHVEWRHQFADRDLVRDEAGYFLVEPGWMGDVERVAAETFCRVICAPDNPRRRRWMAFIAGSVRK